MDEIQEQEAITKQAIKLKKEKIIRGIVCPSCNGELDLKEGVRTFNCKYCGTLLTTKGESGSIKFYVPKKIKRDEAVARTQEWLGKGLAKARGLRASSKVEDVFLVYIPYWRVMADVVGWVFGQERRTRRVGNRTETYYVDVEKKIQKNFDNTFAACDISELGVKKVNLEGDQLLPVEYESLEQEGMLFNIISSEKQVADTAKKEFAASARSSANVDRVTFEHYDLVREHISIVYYPLWVVRYSFQNRTYQVVVDGEDGSICYGKAPGNNLYRAIMGIIGIGVGMYLATLFAPLGLIGELEEGAFVIYIVALIAGIAVMVWGYRKFRYGGEIEEGTGIVPEAKKNSAVNMINEKTGIDSMAVVKDIGKSAVIGGVAGAIFSAISDR
jgi:predicted RNA-binding Zn-ribbon protein involved in translation (DUF1610 family)